MKEQDYIIRQIKRYLDGTISPEEHKELKAWVEVSEQNHILFDHIRELILAHELDKNSLEIDTGAAFSRFKRQIQSEAKPQRKTFRLSYVAAAATVAIMMSVGATISYVVFDQKREEIVLAAPSFHEIVVPRGGRSSVTLADGSKIYLNADTKLKYSDHFGVEDRNLWIEGEGYFVVSKSDIPFVVHCRDRFVTALGTEFNIKAYPEEDILEMLLVKGKIAVKSENTEEEEVILLPSQKLTIRDKVVHKAEAKQIKSNVQTPDRDKSEIVDRSEVMDVETEISWKDNYLVINGEELSDFVIKLERKYDVSVLLADSVVGKIRYTGTLKDESIEQVLSAMALVSDVNYVIDGKEIVLSQRKKR